MKYTAHHTYRLLRACTAHLESRLQEMRKRPDQGDISITTVIIWVASITGALVIAGTIAVIVAKYNGKLNGI
ncbi:hypothetical protein [Streptomyces lasiicapitis]|uniref:Uncharacterized protein n=1 Tax=Streptomyces lasiicapitis TaxID=1923961 RepID=A0ABQ2MVT8_9ACTN|nr:hypothetical protein [Streptomyces lasiicapitis]GGO58984.1 hypothetical protein GCM10012286_79540 [Streptomyces lasiicapitis]